jgi:hypothetical protein
VTDEDIRASWDHLLRRVIKYRPEGLLTFHLSCLQLRLS